MNTKRFFVITICLSLLVFPIGQAIAGSVQCKCPTIRAKGVGNTDCSESESGGECTIDYNTFDEKVEDKAKNLLADILDRPIFFQRMDSGTGFPDGLTPQVAMRLATNPQELVDQLSVYTMVSVVQNQSAVIDNSSLRRVFETLRRRASEISRAFIEDGRQFSEYGIFVTKGCIEIQEGSRLWAMYKSRFSPAALSPQCKN